VIEVLASYDVGGSLARLPLGELRSATQAGRPDRLAMLLVAPDLARETAFEGALRREAAGLRLARVPHLAPLVEVGRRDAALYLVFQQPEGRTLADRLAAGEAFTPEQTTRLVQTVADALDAVHRRGLVHGLVAPETIFVAEDGSATLLGAGLLAAVDEAGLGDAIGGRVNLAFVAPEQVSGRHVVASADGYALGALAHLLLLGDAPPDAIDDAGSFDDPATEAVSTASAPFGPVGPVLRRQLTARPERRYPSCAEFARALAAALDGTELPPAPPAGRAAFASRTRANGAVLAPPRSVVTTSRPVPAPAETPPPAPTTTTPAPEPGQPSTRLRPMSPALVQGVRRMRMTGDTRFLLLGLGVLALGVVCIGGIGLAHRNWWALTGVPIFAFPLAMVVVCFVWQRRAFASDLRIGQFREVIGPAGVERTEERRPSHFLCLHDGRRIFVDAPVYDRLVRLGQKVETKPGFWARLLRPKTVHRIDWLTAILLPASDLIVEVRDGADRVVHREPDLRGISLDG
jgi:serine/threonine-protein kinase